MLKRHEIQVLLRAGHGPREVAELTAYRSARSGGLPPKPR